MRMKLALLKTKFIDSKVDKMTLLKEGECANVGNGANELRFDSAEMDFSTFSKGKSFFAISTNFLKLWKIYCDSA